MADSSAVVLVEQMLGKRYAQIGKVELCELIEAQYVSIERLMGEVLRLDPGSDLIPKRRREGYEAG